MICQKGSCYWNPSFNYRSIKKYKEPHFSVNPLNKETNFDLLGAVPNWIRNWHSTITSIHCGQERVFCCNHFCQNRWQTANRCIVQVLCEEAASNMLWLCGCAPTTQKACGRWQWPRQLTLKIGSLRRPLQTEPECGNKWKEAWPLKSRVWRSHVFVHVEKKDRRKLDPKTTEGRLVGYNKKSGAYLVNMKKRETLWNRRK